MTVQLANPADASKMPLGKLVTMRSDYFVIAADFITDRWVGARAFHFKREYACKPMQKIENELLVLFRSRAIESEAKRQLGALSRC
jgi:hypothetical protein